MAIEHEKTIVAVHGEQIKTLQEQQLKTNKDLNEIKSSITNLDKNVALFTQSVNNVMLDNKRKDDEFKEQYLQLTKDINAKTETTRSIHLDLREIKNSQETMFATLSEKNMEQDKAIEEIRQTIKIYQGETNIETQRLAELIKAHTEKTTFDWFDMFNEGIKTILTESFKYGGVALVMYGIFKASGKL